MGYQTVRVEIRINCGLAAVFFCFVCNISIRDAKVIQPFGTEPFEGKKNINSTHFHRFVGKFTFVFKYAYHTEDVCRNS